MASDYGTRLPHEIRRRDRAVEEDAWIQAFLHRAAMGVMATLYEGQPFINSNLFVYDEAGHALYMHTARVGRTQANVAQEERVCFSVSEMGRLLPAARAKEFSVEYGGVVVFGRATIITDADEARRALQMLMDKYFTHLCPERDYQPITAEELAQTTVYRILIDSWSGKKKEVEPDFPGAFRYQDLPDLVMGAVGR